MSRSKVVSLEVMHKVEIPSLGLPPRWIVWGRMANDHRVVIRRVEDDGNDEELRLRLRSLLVKEFYSAVVGLEFEYGFGHGDGPWSFYAIHEDGLDEQYRVTDFSDILDWFEQNRPDCLRNNLEVLRKEHSARASVAKKENALRRAELEDLREKHRLHEQRLLMEKRAAALKLAFHQNWYELRKWRWEAKHEGVLYVLDWISTYNASDGEIPVEKMYDLVPDRVVLVSRI